MTPQSLPIPQTQIPSAASSSLCAENAGGQRSRLWNKRLNPHTNLSLLRATRIVPTVTIYYVLDRTAVVWIVLAVV